MEKFKSDGIRLAYIDQGDGIPILLIHGFGTNLESNWVKNGWVDKLTGSGHRAVGLDIRGHGRSKKLFDPELYSLDALTADNIRLLDHLNIERAHVIGYSMGARIAAVMALNYPQRVSSVVLGGLGDLNAINGLTSSGSILRALEAPTLEFALDFVARSVRMFGVSNGSNLKAMAACLRKGASEVITPEMYGQINAPVLVVLGDDDVVAGSARRLASLMPNSSCLIIEGLGHLSAMNHDKFIIGAKDFISRHC